MDESDNRSMTRRGVMKGVGGLAALSMSNATVATAEQVLEEPMQTDPHTRETYRSIVDAIVPRTPELEDELGPEHVPGGLDVELEKFLVWDFNHFQEIRLETLEAPKDSGAIGGLLGGSTPEGPGTMPLDLFELELDVTDGETELDGLVDTLGLDLGLLDSTLDTTLDSLRETLSFGDLQALDISIVEDVTEDAEGPASFEVVYDAAGETIRNTYGDYPYAVVFPLAFDLVAAEFLAMGKNEDTPQPRPEFAGGGVFTTLSREDRLRCLWEIVDGGAIDRLDDLLSPMLPAVGILKYVVMAVNGLHGFGYYTEWSGLGSTKTAEPANREMEVDPSQVQSRQQSGYPGPADGYAADWRHAIPGDFEDGNYKIDSDQDPFAENRQLNIEGDLVGDDIARGGDA